MKDSPVFQVAMEVWLILDGGVATVSERGNGRPWPPPRFPAITQLVQGVDPRVALRAAREAREIVQAQDRAPNITGLYKMKLEEALK